MVVGSTILLHFSLLSRCWLDARGAQTGKMTDTWAVAGMAGLSLRLCLCLQLCGDPLPSVHTAPLRDRPRRTAAGLPEEIHAAQLISHTR